jgi:hypothetical protein
METAESSNGVKEVDRRVITAHEQMLAIIDN